jgi:hypothetical protein
MTAFVAPTPFRSRHMEYNKLLLAVDRMIVNSHYQYA